MCCKEIEASHGVIGACHQPVDLIGLGAQEGVIAREVLLGGSAILKQQAQALDRAQTPRNARREERIHERVGMRQHGPACAGGARQAVLNPGLVGEGHERLGMCEQGTDRGIALQQVTPYLLR